MDRDIWANPLSAPEWLVPIDADGPEETAFADAMLHVSNSHQGLRVPADLDDPHGDPGFFVRDVYDVGAGVEREIVNLPHPLGLRVRHGHERLRPAKPARRVLDMFAGLAHVDQTLAGEEGTRLRLSTLTAVHAIRPALGITVGLVRVDRDVPTVALELYWDDTTGNPYLGGAVPQLSMHHVAVERVDHAGSGLRLDCRLAGTGDRVRLASRVTCGGELRRLPFEERRRFGCTIVAQPAPDGTMPFELVWWAGVASEPVEDLDALDAWSLLAEHRAAWRQRWEDHGIEIAGDDRAREAIRFGLFHLLQHELPPRRRGITSARGLSSCYHSGATFFDTELHKDAFWAWTAPEVAVSHLAFRHDTLPEARAFAERTGFAGARFPEATNDLGRENGPHRLLDYPEHREITEWSVREVLHNSADVAYAVHRYHAVTGDTAFLAEKGVELVLETARFAASVLRWDHERQAHVARSVMGPDEYHYHVDNNYFTNYMLRWNLRYALTLIAGAGGVRGDEVSAVCRRIGVDGDEIQRWKTIAESVFLPAPLPEGVPAQHEGYELLPDCPPRRSAQGPAARLTGDEAELAANLGTFATRLIKQADIVLLMHLFPEEFDEDTVGRAFDYYEPRTAHESSLSAAPHGVVAARLGRTGDASAFLLRAARYNIDFQPRAHYRNGLHLSAYAGAWQILVEGFLGAVPVDGHTVALRPRLPADWRGLTVPLAYRGRRFTVQVQERELTVTLRAGPALRIRVEGRTTEVNGTWHCHL